MEGINLIQDLAIVLLAAGAAGIVCKRLGLSVIVGYLLAGVIIGPYTPPFSLLLDIGRIETLSQIGLVFLMFGIGLNLSLSRLRRMGMGLLVATAIGALLVLNLTRLLGVATGWNSGQSLFIAGMFMVSSSAVIAKMVQDLKLSHESPGQLAMGVTVLEDVVAVVMLAVLATQGSAPGESGVGGLLLGMSAFVIVLIGFGLSLVPRLMHRLEARADPELRTIVVAGLLFLVSLVAVRSGYSLALGAFLLGAMIAEMPQRNTVRRAFTGSRDMFSSVFFVSIGLMIDVRLLADVWWIILLLGATMMLVRAFSTSVALTLIGAPPNQARTAGLLLVPIGEFSFLIAQLGVDAGVLEARYYPIAVGISVLTVVVAPLLNRHAPPVLAMLTHCEPRWFARLIQMYHDWLAQIAGARVGGLWWRHSRGRIIAIVVEALFVSGLLTLSERMFAALAPSQLVMKLPPLGFAIAFWASLALLAVVPLIAIWRNLGTLALIFAETVAGRSPLPARAAELGFKALAGLVLTYWLLNVLPLGLLPPLVWLGMAIALVGLVATFSRRFIYWHSEWQHRVTSTLTAADDEAAAESPRWLAVSSDWKIALEEFVIPERAMCAGKSIAGLQIRSRFGSSIVQLERGGHLIVAPKPFERLYPGDRLLLAGGGAAIERTREELGRHLETDEAGLDDARLDTVTLPETVPSGTTLNDLGSVGATGVLVLGIERSGRHLSSPSGNESLLAGDRLLVLAAPGDLLTFRDLLTSRAPAVTDRASAPESGEGGELQ